MHFHEMVKWQTKDCFFQERQELFKTVDADESSTLTANEVLSLNDVLCKKYHRFGAGSLDYSESKLP